MTRHRLLIMSFSNISADARVLKQVNHFAHHYDVTTFGYGPNPDSRVQHLQLDDSRTIHKWTRRELIFRQFSRMYWEQSAIRQGQADLALLPRFDAILANDIDTVGLAVTLNPVHGVHADIHEYSPRQNEELLVWRVFEGPYMKWLCRRFLPLATSMTTVGQGLADEYRRVFGLDAQIVTNATPYANFDIQAVGMPIRLVHSGASLRNRRLETLIDAVAATSSEVSLDLFLMGNDPDYVEELRARASSRVRVLDPLPYDHLIRRLNEYDIGIHVIAPTNFNNRWSLPNKFFDYVQGRLGLIIGPSAEMQRLLEEHQLGAVSDDFGARALTRVLDALTPEEVQSWKANSAASAHALSAETQIDVWDSAIRNLLGDDSS
jgi:hypothetical protein